MISIFGATTALPSSIDLVGTNAVDAYGFVQGAIANRRVECAWVNVANFGSGAAPASIYVGVYSHHVDSLGPDALLATATITNIKTGWNAGRLDKPIDIAGSDIKWLAVHPSNNQFNIPVAQGCAADPYARHSLDFSGAGLPNPFLTTRIGTQCKAALFLAE